MEKTTIVIVNGRTPAFLKNTVTALATVFLPIGLGVIVDSSAMQWAGFGFGLLILVSIAKKEQKSFDTKQAAKDYIDTL